MDLEQGCAELEGDVVVRRGQVTLRAPRLELRETEDGVSVQGPGRLSACTCEEPPLELGFDRAEISRGGDVDLSGPRLMSGDTTLLYLPRLALRGPNSGGLLPPRVGYSGRDGGFLGVAAEVPVDVSERQYDEPGTERERTRVRVGAGAYSRFSRVADGARLELDVSARSGRANAAWESLDGGLVDIDAFGASRSRGFGASYRIDAARGHRALVAPLAFTRVIAAQDRARLAAASWGGSSGLAYAQIRGDAVRGGPGVRGAAAGAASGVSLELARGDAWRLGWDADVLGLGRGERPALGVFRQVLGLDASAALGPLSASAGADSALVLWGGRPLLTDIAPPSGVDLRPAERQLSVQAHVALSLPLSRHFETWRHWVEPKLELAGSAGERPWVQGEAALEQRFGGGAPGELEASLDVAAGGLRGDLSSEVDSQYIRMEIGAAGRWVGASASGVALRDAGGAIGDGALAQGARLRLGRELGVHVRGVVDQALGRSWRALLPGSQALGGGALVAPSALPWASPYNALGTSVGGEVWLPVGPSWTTRVSSVFDLGTSGGAGSGSTWLFGSWAGAYRHPCGCLAVQLELSHRLGRHTTFERPLEALDAALVLDLFEPAEARTR